MCIYCIGHYLGSLGNCGSSLFMLKRVLCPVVGCIWTELMMMMMMNKNFSLLYSLQLLKFKNILFYFRDNVGETVVYQWVEKVRETLLSMKPPKKEKKDKQEQQQSPDVQQNLPSVSHTYK